MLRISIYMMEASNSIKNYNNVQFYRDPISVHLGKVWDFWCVSQIPDLT